MSEKERKILRTIGAVLPTLSEHEQERLLAYSEGMAFVKRESRTAQDTNSP